MKKSIYKVRLYRVLMNCVYGLVTAGIAFFVANIWLDTLYSIAIGLVIAVLYLWLVILGNLIEVTVDGNNLIVKKGSKKSTYLIDECGFKARMKTSGGETECMLYITMPDGKTESVDFELIGIKQFEALLYDIGVVGDDAEVQKIVTGKKKK